MGGARRAWLVAVVLLGAGCVERSEQLTPAEREALRAFVSRRAPAPSHPLRVSFEDKVELVGYDVEPASAAPGTRVTVTWFWRSKKKLDDGFRLFTHVVDANGATFANVDDASVTRRVYPPHLWRPGEYVRDVQEFEVPLDYAADHVVLYVGLWNGPARLRVTEGPTDGENRARGLTLPVKHDGSARPADVPRLRVVRAPSAPRLDGVLDEAFWNVAPPSQPFVETMSGAPSLVPATVRAAWDDANLYFAFEIPDPFLKTRFRSADDHLWEEDCAEIMLDPGGDGLDYFEIQASPRGVVFDTRYDSRRVPQPFGHVEWSSSMRVGVKLRGALDDTTSDTGYTVEAAIPWTAFAAGATPATRPEPGSTWRGNFYVMDARDEGMLASGWSPPRVGDFHVPPRFGELAFEAAP